MARWREQDDDDLEDDDVDEDDLPDGTYHDEEESLVPCPHCREMVPEDVPRCPYCEHYLSDDDQAQPWRRLPPWVLIGVALALGIVVMWIISH